MNELIYIVIGSLIGGVTLFIINKISNKKSVDNAKTSADKILNEARAEADNIKNSKILQAKEKFLELKSEHEKYILSKDADHNDRKHSKSQKLNQKSKKIEKLKTELEEKIKTFDKKNESVEKKKLEIEKILKNQVKEIEKIAGYSANEAKDELLKILKDEVKSQALEISQNIIDEAKLSAKQEAKKIVISSIQRLGTEEAIDNCVSVFNIESDDLKGRIIGREGRNIKAIESATGVEIIVDDTPEAIILSCFDSVRREVARLSLKKLVTDGRIHPARIEEVVKKTSKEIENEIIEIGKRTVIDLGIHGLHPNLIKAVGRMRFRSSYGQNLLQHSKEVAKLCGIMASELGLNPKLAKRAGLLHDIGKVPEEETETPHALLGMQWAEKYGEKSDVCNAIGAHHDEIEMDNLISPSTCI